MLVKCPACQAEYDLEPGTYQCQCGAKFVVEGSNAVTEAAPADDDLNKTIAPRRHVDYDPADDRTMPGKRDRKPDGRFELGDLIMGRYKVLAELGQGGMGVVYKCFDETAGIEIALKALPPELSHSTDEMEDIRDNFQMVSKLVHQNIAISKNLERDNSNGNYYLIMECVEGEDLRRWIKRKRKDGTLDLESVLPVIRQVADALDYAHEQKIIHRDIKPGNIMIDSAGHVKVLDFGLAAQIHTSMTRVSMAYHGTSGTGPYMAPEQWRGRAQGAAADQYALAVMTYEMLAGHLPFESTDAAVLKQAVLDEEPEPLEGVPKNVQEAITRAMSKESAGRFASCADFVAALGGMTVPETTNRRIAMPSSPQEDTPLLTRARLFLKDGDFASAKEYCERALDLAPQNADAYFCRLLAELRLRDESGLSNVPGLGSSKTFKLARQFADEQLAVQLDNLLQISEKCKREKEKKQKRILKVVAVVLWTIIITFIIIQFVVEPAVREYQSRQEEAQRKAEARRQAEEARRQAEEARRRAEERLKNLSSGDIVLDLPGGVKLAMVKVKAGNFWMGSPEDEGERHSDENRHRVTLSKDFYIAKTEVTQAQWKTVMGNNPSNWKGDDLPVEQVSWNDAMKFCNRLNQLGKAPEGWKFTLPTEAQWEYAARGGNRSRGYKYSGSNDLDEVAWYYKNSGDRRLQVSSWSSDELKANNCKTHPVAMKGANELGLYDMSGNVYEWCLDRYEKGYAANPETLTGNSGSDRVYRGGSWNRYTFCCRSAFRYRNDPGFQHYYLGFRLALVPDDESKDKKSE